MLEPETAAELILYILTLLHAIPAPVFDEVIVRHCCCDVSTLYVIRCTVAYACLAVFPLCSL